MRKRRNLFLLFTLSGLIGWAGPVDVHQARGKALQFMQKKIPGVQLEHDEPVYAPKRRSSVKHEVYRDTPAFYVFNTLDDSGYVIISADDRADEVLGYATSGRFNADDIPSNVQAWMDAYAEQITLLDTYSLPLETSALHRPAIEPLLTTAWNQDAPYNASCPLQGSSRTYTGCTATALAQVMKYHEWPTELSSAIPAYTTSTAQLYVPELPPAIFKWDEMEDTYHYGVSAPAVAELMLYCGQALQSDFTRYSTSAYLTDVPQVMCDYFGYDENLEFLYQANYPISQWESIIYSELEAQRPVLHAGTSLGAGHAFVCDGYDGEGMFHFNWGWGGSYDGYYRLALLTPGTGGIGAGTEDGFSANQRIVVGIQPPTGNQAELKPFSSLNLQQSGTNLFCDFQNPNPKFATCYVGFGLVNEQGEVQQLLKDCGPMGLKGYNLERNWAGLYLGPYGEVNLEPGVYRIAAVSRTQSEGDWLQGGNLQTYFEVEIGEGNELLRVEIHPIKKMEITQFECISGKVVGTSQKVRVTVENQGDDFNSMLYFFVSETDQMDSPITRIPLLLHGGETLSYDVHFFAQNVGTYYLWLSETSDGLSYLIKKEIEIVAPPTKPAQLELVDCVVAPDGSNAVVEVRNTSDEPYYREIVAQLYEDLYDEGIYYYVKSMDCPGEIPADTTKSFSFVFDGLKENRNYYLYIGYYSLHNDEFTTQLGTSQYFTPISTGIDDIIHFSSKPISIYHLNGKRMEHFREKGIYIVDGKKIIVK